MTRVELIDGEVVRAECSHCGSPIMRFRKQPRGKAWLTCAQPGCKGERDLPAFMWGATEDEIAAWDGGRPRSC